MTAPIGSVSTPVSGMCLAGRDGRTFFFGDCFGAGAGAVGLIVGVPDGNKPGGAVVCDAGVLGSALGFVLPLRETATPMLAPRIPSATTAISFWELVRPGPLR